MKGSTYFHIYLVTIMVQQRNNLTSSTIDSENGLTI